MSFDNVFAALFQVVIIASGELSQGRSRKFRARTQRLLLHSQHVDGRHVQHDGRRLLRLVLVLHRRPDYPELRTVSLLAERSL